MGYEACQCLASDLDAQTGVDNLLKFVSSTDETLAAYEVKSPETSWHKVTRSFEISLSSWSERKKAANGRRNSLSSSQTV